LHVVFRNKLDFFDPSTLQHLVAKK